MKQQPNTIILSGVDTVIPFLAELGRMSALDYDVDELMSIAVASIAQDDAQWYERLTLNANSFANHGVFKFAGTNMTLLTDKTINGEREITGDGAILSRALLRLGDRLHAHLQSLELYDQQGQLNYFYSRIAQGDVVLSRLPY